MPPTLGWMCWVVVPMQPERDERRSHGGAFSDRPDTDANQVTTDPGTDSYTDDIQKHALQNPLAESTSAYWPPRAAAFGGHPLGQRRAGSGP